ncbi:TPA: recombinase family protein [Clostridium botulinum]|uniref:recombinase family protein n=1 Tax=Clostridium botulinum TaxID=1491 RepID=UPI00035BB1A2|nr:recombinase family protein [Clostridium botulinum]EPS56390.1 putative resolvase [Clostridium botulinum Af84]MBN3359529.1 recombinase family protein [Clostridium botulinum]NFM84319.1 recombinase family protein [Clostridium botulinum]NFP13122.1 recombinase family protein [Clostridium botulinum]NFR30629.1 recombinase family protein [Clostridium botulinum]
MSNKVAIYVRVSTHHQIDKDSLPLQRQDLLNYTKYMLNIDEYEIFEDAGYSAKNTDRPNFQNMMSKIRKNEFSHLLVWKIDRISRNLIDFCDMYEELKKYNCTFVSKNEQFDTSSAMGEAMLKIILVFAELERKLTGERVTAVMLDRASKGLWNGAPIPLGYVWDKIKKFPIIDESEKNTIELIYNTYLKSRSTTVVRGLLNANSIKTKRGGSWTTKTVSDIIRNPFYKGTYRYNYKEPGRGKIKNENEWIVLDDNHPGIIGKELWEKCNEIMNVNAQRNNASGFRANGKVHVFASLLECGECHNNLYSKQDKPNMDGFVPSIYVCSGRYNHLGCSQKTISDNYIGTFIFSFISNILTIQNKIKKLDSKSLEKTLLTGKVFKDIVGIENIEYMQSKYYAKNELRNKEIVSEDNSFNLEIIRKEKAKFQRALERLEDLYLFDDDAMSEKDYIIKKNKITGKLSEINNKLKELNNFTDKSELNLLSEISNFMLSKELLNTQYINYKKLVLTVGRERLKDFVKTIIDKIIIKDKKILNVKFKNGLVIKFVYKY